MRGNIVNVTVSGPTGCGKSAVMGEIAIALQALGLSVSYADAKAAESERRLTGADWQTALDLYKPAVVLREVNEPRPAPCRPTHKSNLGARWDFLGWTVCYHRDGRRRFGLKPRLERYGAEGWCLSLAWFEIGRVRPAQGHPTEGGSE